MDEAIFWFDVSWLKLASSSAKTWTEFDLKSQNKGLAYTTTLRDQSGLVCQKINRAPTWVK